MGSYGVRQNFDGGICFPAPFYQNCIYDFSPFSLGFYPLWTVDNPGRGESDLRQPRSITQPQAPPPPVTPALHEYNWPAQGDTSATFSIVTTSGAVYLATMAWTEGENLHFTSVEGGARQIPLATVSRPLTQAANARKSLTLPQPSAEPVAASVATTN
jgi:hypothetical protein